MTHAATVLVVDDDVDVCESIQLTLELNGVHALCAHDGAQALAVLRAGARPDLILLDLMMPVMTGAEFRVEQLRDPALARIPVVVLSGDRTSSDKAAALGAEGLAKPIGLDALLAVVRRYCDVDAGT